MLFVQLWMGPHFYPSCVVLEADNPANYLALVCQKLVEELWRSSGNLVEIFVIELPHNLFFSDGFIQDGGLQN